MNHALRFKNLLSSGGPTEEVQEAMETFHDVTHGFLFADPLMVINFEDGSYFFMHRVKQLTYAADDLEDAAMWAVSNDLEPELSDALSRVTAHRQPWVRTVLELVFVAMLTFTAVALAQALFP